METRIDQILMNYLESLLYTDDLESKSVRLMLDEIRLIYDLDCLFVFENLTFRNDFVYSYYGVKTGNENRLAEIVQFTDLEYAKRLKRYNNKNVSEETCTNPQTGRTESTLRYGFLTGETFQGSVGFRFFSEHTWTKEETQALQKLGRLMRIYLDSKFRRRLRVERSQNVLRAIEKDFDGIYFINVIGNQIQTVNTQQRIFDTRDIQRYDDFFQAYYNRLFLEDDRARFVERYSRENIQAVLAHTSSFEDCFCVGSKEHMKWERVHVILSDTDGYDNIYHIALTISDVTKEHEQIEELNRKIVLANQAKSNFLAQMSHDIRTPMNAIIGFADLIERHIEDRDKVLSYLSKMKSSSEFLLSLINNVLEMAKIESRQVEIEEEYCDMRSFFDSLFYTFSESMKKKGLSFQRNVQVEHFHVLCDITKQREIFLNLLSNAQKYTPAGGKVTMDVTEVQSNQEGYVRIKTVIADNGIGMAPEFVSHIFETFTRERTRAESTVEGFGLGMSIVKQLVDLMDGSIAVKSQPGKGTEITVILPQRISDETAKKTTDKEAVKYGNESFWGKRILLAEDNELNAEIAVTMLEEAGFAVEHAGDGLVCMEMLQGAEAGYYDLILMDIQMPNMDGYEATRTIRGLADAEKAEIPIIAMTANAFEEDKRAALKAGMNGHIAKPVQLDRLMSALAEILSG